MGALIVDLKPARNGCRYARSGDINLVRAELQRNGFKQGRTGWRSDTDHTVPARFFYNGKWSTIIDRQVKNRKQRNREQIG